LRLIARSGAPLTANIRQLALGNECTTINGSYFSKRATVTICFRSGTFSKPSGFWGDGFASSVLFQRRLVNFIVGRHPKSYEN